MRHRLKLALALVATLLALAGCGGSSTTGAVDQPTVSPFQPAEPTELSVGSKELGEVAVAQMRIARAVSGAALVAPFVRPGAQSGPAGPFTIELQNQVLRVLDPQSGTLRGVLTVQPPVANADGTTTVQAVMGDGQQGFFGCTGTLFYTFDAQGLLSLRLQQLLAQNHAGEYTDGLLPPAVGGLLTRDATGNLTGRLNIRGVDGVQARNIFSPLIDWFVDAVITPIQNAFTFQSPDGTGTGSATVDASFNTVGGVTDTRSSGDQQSLGYLAAPGGVASITGMDALVANNGSRTLPGANVIGQNGGGVIGQNGGNVIGQNGGNVIGQNGGNVIGQNGGNLIPDSARLFSARYALMALSDVDNDAPSSLGATFGAQPNMRLRLVSQLAPDVFADTLQAGTGTVLLYGVQAVDAQNRPIPYTTTLGCWGASSASSSPVLYQDPNSPGRFVAVNPGQSDVSFIDLQTDLVAQSHVTVTGDPVVVPGTISFAREPEGEQTTFTPFSPAPRVQVRDTNGRPVANAPVILEAVGPQAGFISNATVTDGSGIATFDNFLVGSPGTYVLLARTGPLYVIGAPFQVVSSGLSLQSIRLQAAGGATSLTVNEELQLQAIGTLSDGRTLDVTNLVDWVSLDDTASITPSGLLRGLEFGTASIEVFQKGGGATAHLDLQVNPDTIPGSLVITAQPPATVSPGAPFSLTVQVQDAPAATITVKLLNNPTGATLGGTTTRPTSGGQVTFNDLTLDRTGTGFTLQLSASGFPNIQTSAFDVVDSASTGKLLVNVGTNVGQTPGMAVADIFPNGDVTQVNGSPFASGNPSPNSQGRTVRLGSFVYAPYQGGLQTYAYDPATGQLTSQALQGANSTSRFLAGNGSNALFYLTTGGNLNGAAVDPATGAITGQVNTPLPAQAVGATNWDTWALEVMPGAASDLVFVAGRSTDSANPNIQGTVEAVQVQVYRFDRSVSPPTLTFLGCPTINTGIPFDPAARQLPLATALVGNILYVGTLYEDGGGPITRFDVNPATGQLSNQAEAFTLLPPGSPEWLLPVSHPVAGQLMYLITVDGAASSQVAEFRVEANGDLSFLTVTPFNAGFFRQMVEFTSATGARLLAVLELDGIWMFSLDANTGAPTFVRSTAIQDAASIAK